MPLVFHTVKVPDELRRDHTSKGGKDLAMYKAAVHDGFLRVMSAKEEIMPNTMKHHLSMSIGPEEGEPTRKPTDAECNEAMVLWPAAELEEETYGTDSMVRHFWEQ